MAVSRMTSGRTARIDARPQYRWVVWVVVSAERRRLGCYIRGDRPTGDTRITLRPGITFGDLRSECTTPRPPYEAPRTTTVLSIMDGDDGHVLWVLCCVCCVCCGRREEASRHDHRSADATDPRGSPAAASMFVMPDPGCSCCCCASLFSVLAVTYPA